MSVKVFEYGLSKPHTNATRLEEQFLSGHRYYNDLIEQERLYRGEREVILSGNAAYKAASDQVDALLSELDSLRTAINAAKAQARANVATVDLDAAAKVVKEKLRAGTKAKWEARRAAVKDAALRPALDALDQRNFARCKWLYNDSQAFWGTKLVVDQAVDAARKKSLDMPKFRHWDGRAQVAIQIQKTKPLSAKGLFACQDSRIRIAPVPDSTYDSRQSRRRNQRTRLWFCIDSVDPTKRIGKTNPPLFVEFDVYLHRPLPADANIKWARILRENVGGLPRFKLQLTVETFECDAPLPTNEAVAVDLGWAQVEDGSFRVGYYAGAGHVGGGVLPDEHGAIAVDSKLAEALTKASSIRSIRDRVLEEMRPKLAQALAGLSQPDWFVKETAHLAQWRSAERFHVLARHWLARRFEGDESAYSVLAAWAWGTPDRRGGDLHLLQWEANQRDKALRRRREFYRVEAARLADRYAKLVLEDFNLSPLSRKAAPETEGRSACRDTKVLVSPSELRRALVQAFEARGREVVEVNPAGTSKTCHVCGERTQLVVGRRDQTCEKCGAAWDRDYNGATNILWLSASRPVLNESVEALAQTKSAEGRWNRRKAKKAALVAATPEDGRSQEAA